MQRRSGDSLGEVLIVIAILVIMAATAIPNLLRAAIADYKSLAVRPISVSGPAEAPRKSSSSRH